MIAYQIGDQRFRNPYQCFEYAARNHPHSFPKFCVHDELFSTVDWTTEPTKTFEQLCDERAIALRQQYEKLILAFSGGTDSTTMINAFIRTKTPIDEIIIVYKENSNAYPAANVHWVLKNFNKKTKITPIESMTSQFIVNKKIQSSDWIFAPDATATRYGDTPVPNANLIGWLETQYQNYNWALITGYEKPHLVYTSDRWHVTHLDKVLEYVTAFPDRTEMFFIPKQGDCSIHVKQSHTLLKFLKTTINPIPAIFDSSTIKPQSLLSYNEYAFACGRDVEVTVGASFCQKQNNINNIIYNTFLSIKTETNKKLLDDFLDNAAKKFFDGFESVFTDTLIVEYMKRHKLFTPNFEYNGIYSNFFKLSA